LKQPAAESNNANVQEAQRAAAAERLAKNVAVSEAVAQNQYPNEIFLSSTAKLQSINKFTKNIELPKNVHLAGSRIPQTKGDAEKLKKELRQASILACHGNSVFLTPEPGRYKVRASDAIVNGVPYEFRNITGKAVKIETRFSEAKKKADNINVFINIDSDVGIGEARRRIGQVLNRHPEYTGKIVVSFKGNKTYFWDSSNFR
jgi:hypothetical protein